MVTRQMGLDDGVAFGVKGNSADRRPVTRVTRPARRVALAGALVDLMPGSQDRVIAAFMARGRADVTDAAVQMLMVVPMHERAGYSGSNDAWCARVSETLTFPMMGLCHTLDILQPFWNPLRLWEGDMRLPNAVS